MAEERILKLYRICFQFSDGKSGKGHVGMREEDAAYMVAFMNRVNPSVKHWYEEWPLHVIIAGYKGDGDENAEV